VTADGCDAALVRAAFVIVLLPADPLLPACVVAGMASGEAPLAAITREAL
jgi:hypothetical protein